MAFIGLKTGASIFKET